MNGDLSSIWEIEPCQAQRMMVVDNSGNVVIVELDQDSMESIRNWFNKLEDLMNG